MAQTDRQTDKPATHWKSAIFDVDDNWSRLEAPPACVKTIYKQKEICPSTGKPHFQIHVVCNRQVRFTQLTAWIKATKWIPVWGKEHIENSINYCHKKDSAVEGTYEVVQGEKYYQMHELLEEIAKQYDHPYPSTPQSQSSEMAKAISFETLTNRMVERDVKWVNKLCNPQIKKMWEMYKYTFISKQFSYLEETSGAYIIEAPPSEDSLESEDGVCLIV